ncbi:MAG: malto-oligosyltrehalose synthase, partial [Chloroflexia bacterium]|nr:malto-oligosyltrehalose synthase [Chloroflexia bacterium]
RWFPISPSTYPLILRKIEERLEGDLDSEAIDFLELRSLRTALGHLDHVALDMDPASFETDRATRRQEQTLAKHRLAALCERSPIVRHAVTAVVVAINGSAGDPPTFDALDELLDHQHYRLSSWRVAAEEINYRRFFAINSLAAIRQEIPEVFDDSHRFLASLIADGHIDGLRIDHPDGLWDPAGYFRSLQRLVVEEGVRRTLDHERPAPMGDNEWIAMRSEARVAIDTALDEVVDSGNRRPFYVVAEKILEHGETLRDDWAVSGTVGYEFAQAATGVFVDAGHRQAFDRLYAQFTGDRTAFNDLVYDMKQRMMREAFASEVNVLTNELNRISERDRHFRDFTLNNLRDALREILACFSVYRTYTTTGLAADDRDRRYIESAVSQARRRNPTMDLSVFDFIADVMLNSVADERSDTTLASRSRFGMKLQQLSGPVMAKGLEDTAFYRFNRLVSLNEVGGDPNRFGITVDQFHRQNRVRRRSWPTAMLTSSTHDTKRAEDVRARIDVLSEIPAEWRAALMRWSRANRKLKRRVEGVLAPRRADEYVLYQTLIGTWPLVKLDMEGWERYTARLQEYVVKVGREANRFTNWVNPDEAYEAALTGFVAGMMDRRRSRAFLDDLEAFADRVAEAGLRNALGQQVLKLTSPGVPDIYQGTELWDDSLVDPDNRRPVNFEARAALLEAAGEPSPLWDDRRTGAIKLAVTARLLHLRATYAELFAEGDYTPLNVTGERNRHVIAFARSWAGRHLIVAVARLTADLDFERNETVWGDT